MIQDGAGSSCVAGVGLLSGLAKRSLISDCTFRRSSHQGWASKARAFFSSVSTVSRARASATAA